MLMPPIRLPRADVVRDDRRGRVAIAEQRLKAIAHEHFRTANENSRPRKRVS